MKGTFNQVYPRLWLVLATWVTSCGPSAAPVAPDGAMCQMPDSTPPVEVIIPESRVGLSLRVTERRLLQELHGEVPQVLAQAKGRKIGDLGKLTYNVRRGDLNVAIERNNLVVSTPLQGNVQVCKPIGPICVRYGACTPRWVAQISVPLQWTSPLRATTRVELTNRCVLKPVGYNATGRLKKITSEQEAKIAQRINRQLRRAQRQLWERFSEGLKPVRIPGNDGSDSVNPDDDASTGCIGFVPKHLEYDLSESKSDKLFVVSAQMVGRVTQDCQTRAAPPEPTFNSELDPTIQLNASVQLGYPQIVKQLQANAIGEVVVMSSLAPESTHNQLHVGLGGYAECGLTWLKVTPQLSKSAIHLWPVADGPVADSPVAAGSAAKDRAAKWLTRQKLQLPQERPRLQQALGRFESIWNRQAAEIERNHEIVGTLTTEYQPSFLVGADDLIVLMSVSGTVTLESR